MSEIRQGNIYVDLKGINKRQLIGAGMKSENIDVCNFCTVCNNSLFFSYRKENATTNRHSAVVKLSNILCPYSVSIASGWNCTP